MSAWIWAVTGLFLSPWDSRISLFPDIYWCGRFSQFWYYRARNHSSAEDPNSRFHYDIAATDRFVPKQVESQGSTSSIAAGLHWSLQGQKDLPECADF